MSGEAYSDKLCYRSGVEAGIQQLLLKGPAGEAIETRPLEHLLNRGKHRARLHAIVEEHKPPQHFLHQSLTPAFIYFLLFFFFFAIRQVPNLCILVGEREGRKNSPNLDKLVHL
jgi:hypothetical protein